MNIISIIVGGLAGSALALEYADLPPCGQICIRNMFNLAYNINCPPYPNGRPNLECLCNDASFFNGIRDCAYGACYIQDAENTLGLAAIYCTDPKYKSPNYPCPSPLLQPGVSPAPIGPAPGVNSNSGSGPSADNDISNPSGSNNDISNPSGSNNQGTGSSGSTNSNQNPYSDDTSPNANNNNNNNGNNNNNANPRVDVLTYVSNGNTFVATVTVTPAADGVVSSNNVGGGGLRTVTAYVSPSRLVGNTAVASKKTNKVDYGNATPTSASSGASETNSAGAKETGKGATKAAGTRETGSLQERLLAVALGLFMVL